MSAGPLLRKESLMRLKWSTGRVSEGGTHAGEAVALVSLVEHRAEPGGREIEVVALARAFRAGPGDDKAILDPQVGWDADGSATGCVVDAGWGREGDTDAGVLGAGVI